MAGGRRASGMRQSSRCCPAVSLGCLPFYFSPARASGTNLSTQSSLETTNVSPSRTAARASTTAWPGQPARRHRNPLESVRLGEAVRQRKHAGLTVEPELLAHISPLGWGHILLTSEYRWPKLRHRPWRTIPPSTGIDPFML